jgi:predicted nuclease with TOPRIM domain
MVKLKEVIREYLNETIQTKKRMRRRIYQLEDEIKELRLNIKDITAQKERYKESNRKLRKKINDRKGDR